MNNNLMLFLPFLMNGKTGNMTELIKTLLKAQTGKINPMTLLMFNMLSMQNNGEKKEEGTEAVKEFGGEDVVNLIKSMMQKNQSV